MITIKINGRELKAETGHTILQIARQNGIEIPTLCHHDSIEPYGACRLCLVEISKRGRSRMVASCLYPVEDGLEVRTDTPRVINSRKIILELLLARCSENEVIRNLASQMGVNQTFVRPEYLEKNDCIVCGLCVRACEQVVGVSAITLVNRGITKEPASPFLESAEDCIGCGSCYYICPTHAIKLEDRGDSRIIQNWNVEFKLRKCKVCGFYWAPEKQLAYIIQKWSLPQDFFDTCPNCK